MTLRELLTQARRPALVVGNGVNLYGGSKNANSWSALLADLRKKYCGGLSEESAEAMSLPELYDALTIGAGASVDLQREFVGAMAEWAPTDAHRQIATWAAKNEAPILTTNFDGMFERSFPACKLQILTDRDVGFTRFYPWNVVSAPTTISDPLKGFGIWHLHGMERYPSSIRLGLTHYMGCAQRARVWLMHGSRALLSNKRTDDWFGSKTWLHIFFSLPLLFVGLGLERDEVFVRWLLIERERYFQRFGECRQPTYFVDVLESRNSQAVAFVRALGGTVIEVATFDELYAGGCWQT